MIWEKNRLIKRFAWTILSLGIEAGGVFRSIGCKSRKYCDLLEFRNKYLGKRCFICATGPSLTKEDVSLLKNEYTFGVNSICEIYSDTDWRPTFYVFQDYPIYEIYSEIINSSRKTIVFSGDPLVDYKRGYKICPKVKWIRFPLNWAYHKFAGLSGKPYVKFSENAYQRIYSGYTVTYSAIQLAMYMGFTEIFLLGVDCNYNAGKKNHFKLMKKEFIRSRIGAKDETEVQMLAYEKAKEQIKQRKIGIYNVTRGGKLEIFERRILEEVLNEK